MDDMQKDLQEKNDEVLSPGLEETDELTKLQESLAMAEDMAKKNQENYLRVLAEIENMRKRNQREREEYLKFASQPIIKKLLPIIDDFERAVNIDVTQDFESLYKGMEMIYKKLLEVITSEGVEPIEALGKPFDPQYHQPLMMEESSEPENTVLEEMQKGYIMHGRVIRPSLVKVSN